MIDYVELRHFIESNLIPDPVDAGTTEGWSHTTGVPNATISLGSVDVAGTMWPATRLRSNATTQFFSPYFDVDPTKTYRVRVSVVDPVQVSGNQFYMGTNQYIGGSSSQIEPVTPATGAVQAASSNFYFNYESAATTGIRDHVAYIFPAGTPEAEMAGFGQNIRLNARFLDGTTSARIRILNWSNTDGIFRDMWITNVSVSEVGNEDATELITTFSNLSFDKKYRDLGALNFDMPLAEAKRRGIGDQSLIGVHLGYSTGTTKEVERYVIDSTNDDKVSDNTRMRSLGAKSSLNLLGDALVYPSNWPVTAPTGHSFVESTPGTIFRTLIERAHSRGTITQINAEAFSGTQDANAVPWAHQTSQDLSTGTSYWQVLSDLMARGLVDAKMEGWELKLFNGDTLGNHIDVGTVEVRPAHNVTEMVTNTDSSESCTTVLIEGEEGSAIERSDTNALGLLGRRRERYVQQGGIKDADVLNILADAELAMYARIPTEETVGVTDFENLEIFQDFDVADWIWVRYEGEEHPVERRIHQIVVAVDENRNLQIGMTLNSILYEQDIRNQRKIEAYTGSGGNYGSIPNTGFDNSVPNPPTGLSITSDFYIDSGGNYTAAFVANFNEPTTNVDGTALDLSGYELQWKYVESDFWSFTQNAAEPNFGYGPVNPGRTIDVRVRAKGENAQVSTWVQTQHTLAVDTTPPPTPSAPEGFSMIERVDVEWDGLTSTGDPQPLDFTHAEVWMAATPDFTPGTNSQQIGTFPRGGGIFAAPGFDYDQPTYFKLVSVDQAGNKSSASSAGSGEKLKAVDPVPNEPPGHSPDVTITPGIGVLHARWYGVMVNAPSVEYDVHVSTEAGFVPDAATLLSTTPATALTIKTFRGSDLIQNGSFEDPITGFWAGGFGTIARTQSPTVNGSYSLAITTNSTWSAYAATPGGTSGIPVKPDTTHRAIARLRAAEGLSTRGRINIIWIDRNGVELYQDFGVDLPVVEDGWTVVANEVVSPPNAAYAKIGAGGYGGGASGDVVYLDQVEFLDRSEDSSLKYDTTYFVAVVARTPAGPADAPGATGYGRLQKVDSPDISNNYVYTGQLTADQVTGGKFSSAVSVSGRFTTEDPDNPDSPARVEMDPEGIRIYKAGDVPYITLPVSGEAKFSGTVEATSLTVQDGLEIRGQNNNFTIGSKTTLQSSVQASGSPPTVTIGYEKSPLNVNSLNLEVDEGGWTDANESEWFSAATFLEDGYIRVGHGRHTFAKNPLGDSEFRPRTYTRAKAYGAGTGRQMHRAVVLGEVHKGSGDLNDVDMEVRVYDDRPVSLRIISVSRTSNVRRLNFADSITAFGIYPGTIIEVRWPNGTIVKSRTPVIEVGSDYVTYESVGADEPTTTVSSDWVMSAPPVSEFPRNLIRNSTFDTSSLYWREADTGSSTTLDRTTESSESTTPTLRVRPSQEAPTDTLLRNLIPNPAPEDGIHSWVGVGSTSFSQGSGSPIPGHKYHFRVQSNFGTNALRSHYIPATPGDTLKLSTWYIAHYGGTDMVLARFHFRDANGNYLPYRDEYFWNTEQLNKIAEIPTGIWFWLSLAAPVTVPAGAVEMAVRLQSMGGAGFTGVVLHSTSATTGSPNWDALPYADHTIPQIEATTEARNLIPDPTLSSANWTTGTTASTFYPRSGSTPARLHKSGSGWYARLTLSNQADYASVTPGEYLLFRASIKTDGWFDVSLRVKYYDAAGNTPSASYTESTGHYNSSAFINISHESMVPEGATMARAWIEVYDIETGQNVYIENMSLVKVPYPYGKFATEMKTYWDGDTPDGGGYVYSWEGTPHASPSRVVKSLGFANTAFGWDGEAYHSHALVKDDSHVREMGAMSDPTPVVAGEVHTASAYIWSDLAGKRGRFRIIWYSDLAGTQQLTSVGNEFSISSGYQRHSVSNLAPATAKSASVSIESDSAIFPNYSKVYVDSVMLDQSSTLNPFRATEGVVMSKFGWNHQHRLGRRVGPTVDPSSFVYARYDSSLGEDNLLIRHFALDVDRTMTKTAEDTITVDFAEDEKLIGVTWGSAKEMKFLPSSATDKYYLVLSTNLWNYVCETDSSGVPWVVVIAGSDPTPAWRTQHEFPAASGMHRLFVAGDLETSAFAGFRTFPWSTGSKQISRYTDITWDPNSAELSALDIPERWMAAFTWTDAVLPDTHQTPASVQAFFNMHKRAALFISTPNLPPPVEGGERQPDDVNTFTFYLARGYNRDALNTELQFQKTADHLATSMVLTEADFNSGVNPPETTEFVGQRASRIESSAKGPDGVTPKFFLDGDGTVQFETVTVTGGGSWQQLMPVAALLPWTGWTGLRPDSVYKNVPDGFLLADGSAVLIAMYPELADAYWDGYNYLYGSPDGGATQFYLPNPTYKFLRGGPAAGPSGGSDEVTLTVANLPSHNHDASGLTTNTTGSHRHELQYSANTGGGGKVPRGTSTQDIQVDNSVVDNGAHSHNVTGSTGNTGSGTPFDAVPSHNVVMFIVKH